MKKIHIKHRLVEIVAGVIIVVFILLISFFRIFEVFELATLDLRFKARPAQKISKDIVLIEIAQDTLDKIGSWPIDRAFHAFLIDALTEYGVHAIVFDILFSQPQNEISDEKLTQATEKSGRVYLTRVFRLSQKRQISHFSEAETIESEPMQSLRQAAKGIGHINVITDIDGKRRKVPLFIQYRNKLYPQLSLLVACHYLGKSIEDISITPGRYVKIERGTKVPINKKGETIINFAGRWGKAFKHYSFIDILKSYTQLANNKKPIVELDELKNKICIVGLTAVATHDLNPIPLQSRYPMVGLHANLINSIICSDFISRANKYVNLFILILLGAAVIFCVMRLRPALSLLCSLAILAGFAIITFLVFGFFDIWIDLFYPIILISLIYLFATFYKYISERNKRLLMEKELDIAQKIQRSFLKETPPEKQGLDIAAIMYPAKSVGGDLYDFVDIDFMDTEENRIGVMVGDVSGKGIPAALYMAKTVSDFRFHAKTQKPLAEIITSLNDQLSTDSASGLFVTLFYMVINVKEKKANVVDAGHLPLVAAHKDKDTEELKLEGGMALGIMEGMDFTQSEISFSPGDVFVLYSDGVTEARNKKKEEFGIERLKQTVTENKEKSAKEIAEEVYKHIIKFRGKAPQHDDITVVVVKITE